MNPITEIQNDITGVAALADWLGADGNPVHPMVAEFRAQRCVEGNDGKPCPLNKAAGWWETAKNIIADWIRAEMRIKSHMGLTVGPEERLHLCAACGCCLRLKVWTPADVIRRHVSDAQIKRTPDWCWMRKERIP